MEDDEGKAATTSTMVSKGVTKTNTSRDVATARVGSAQTKRE